MVLSQIVNGGDGLQTWGDHPSSGLGGFFGETTSAKESGLEIWDMECKKPV
jgi:hypothetical protein